MYLRRHFVSLSIGYITGGRRQENREPHNKNMREPARADFEGRLKDLKLLKPSFGFLENFIVVGVIENGCPTLKPILTDKAAYKIFNP